MKAMLVHANLMCEIIETNRPDVQFGGETLIPLEPSVDTDQQNRVYMRNRFKFTVTHDDNTVTQFNLAFYVHPDVTRRYPRLGMQDLGTVVMANIIREYDSALEFLQSRELNPDEILGLTLYEESEEPDEDPESGSET